MISINKMYDRHEDAEKLREEIITKVDETLVPLKKAYDEWKEPQKRNEGIS